MRVVSADDVPYAQKFHSEINDCIYRAVEAEMSPQSCSMILSQIAGRAIGILVALTKDDSEEYYQVALENFDIGFNDALRDSAESECKK